MDIGKAKNLLKNVKSSDYVQLKSMTTEQLDELENAVNTMKHHRRQQQEATKWKETPKQPKEVETEMNKCIMTELRSLVAPPEIVKNTLSALLLVLGYSASDIKKWIMIQTLMSNPETMVKCKNIQIKDISKKQAHLAEEKLKDNGDYASVKKVSMAAAEVHKWVSEVVGKVLQGQ